MKDVRLIFSGLLAKDPDEFFKSWKKNEVKILRFLIYADDGAKMGEHEAKLSITGMNLGINIRSIFH